MPHSLPGQARCSTNTMPRKRLNSVRAAFSGLPARTALHGTPPFGRTANITRSHPSKTKSPGQESNLQFRRLTGYRSPRTTCLRLPLRHLGMCQSSPGCHAYLPASWRGVPHVTSPLKPRGGSRTRFQPVFVEVISGRPAVQVCVLPPHRTGHAHSIGRCFARRYGS